MNSVLNWSSRLLSGSHQLPQSQKALLEKKLEIATPLFKTSQWDFWK